MAEASTASKQQWRFRGVIRPEPGKTGKNSERSTHNVTELCQSLKTEFSEIEPSAIRHPPPAIRYLRSATCGDKKQEFHSRGKFTHNEENLLQTLTKTPKNEEALSNEKFPSEPSDPLRSDQVSSMLVISKRVMPRGA